MKTHADALAKKEKLIAQAHEAVRERPPAFGVRFGSDARAAIRDARGCR